MSREVEVLPDGEALARRAADLFVPLVARAVAARGVAHVVLTGGGTGIAVLRAIATRGSEIDWSRVHVWWGDERFVPAKDDERNDLQADDALLNGLAIPEAQVHRVPASDGEYGDDPDAAAEGYAAELARHGTADAPYPLFDVLMLGLGEEGHTASIFPHSPATQDRRAVCAVRDCPKPPPTRVTLTAAPLSHAREVWMMTTGAAKAPAVARAIHGAQPVDLPAAGPQGQEITRWLLDEAAAGEL